MRKTITATLIITSALALTACGSSDETTPTFTTETSTSTATVAAAPTTTERTNIGAGDISALTGVQPTMIEQMEAIGLPVGGIQESAIQRTAISACDTRTDDGLPHSAVLSIVDEGMPYWNSEESNQFLFLAYFNHCPEHL